MEAKSTISCCVRALTGPLTAVALVAPANHTRTMLSLFGIVSVSGQAVLQLFVMMALGIYFQRGLGLMGFHLRKELSTIIFSVGLPCMLLTKIAFSIDLSNAAMLLVVPLFTMVHVAFAYGMARFSFRFLQPYFATTFHEGHYLASTLVGNSGTIPFMMTASVLHMHPWSAVAQSSEDEAATVARGIGYISVYLILVTPAMWSIAYPMILSWSAQYERRDRHSNGAASDEDEDAGVAANAAVPVADSSTSFSMASLCERLKSLMNPPMAATIAGIVLGFCPPLRGVFANATGNAPLQNTIWSSMRLCADIVIPLQLIMLGASVLDATATVSTIASAITAPIATGTAAENSSRDKDVASNDRVEQSSSPTHTTNLPLGARDVYGVAASVAPPSPISVSVADAANRTNNGDVDDFPLNVDQVMHSCHSAGLHPDWRVEVAIARSRANSLEVPPSPRFAKSSAAFNARRGTLTPSASAKSVFAFPVAVSKAKSKHDEFAQVQFEMGSDGAIHVVDDSSHAPSISERRSIHHSTVNEISSLASAAPKPATALALASAPLPPAAVTVVPTAVTTLPVTSTAVSFVGSLYRLRADLGDTMKLCPWPIALASVLIRQILLPIAGLLLVQIAISIGLLDKHNRVMLLVLLLERCVWELNTLAYRVRGICTNT